MPWTKQRVYDHTFSRQCDAQFTVTVVTLRTVRGIWSRRRMKTTPHQYDNTLFRMANKNVNCHYPGNRTLFLAPNFSPIVLLVNEA
mmetsp:Transcript_13721/g.43345  ORF Transcript_13721/g.43345 Transcript_13721/m.43345 type:complete len:86 (-) Transcript_13721:376-633(-)